MNIEGVVRELPLFEPPIDPALLVRAAAMGLDLSSVMNDINAPTPYYRFGFMLQKAVELAGELKSFGAALLSALEKKDAEALAILRAGHETNMLKAIQNVKEQQIVEAATTLEGLRKAKEVVQFREQYYRTREFMSPAEITQLVLKEAAGVVQIAAQAAKLEAAPLALLPGVFLGGAGAFGSPLQFQNVWPPEGAAYSGVTFGDVAMVISSMLSNSAEMTASMASYERRKDDWDFQAKSAAKELQQVDKQIAAAEIRLAISEKELENQSKQIENAAAVEDFLRNKYTNQELYDWTLSKLSAMYFQSYKLAYDVAKRAERAYRFERGLATSNFIKFGYWDSRRKGLLSGEQLHQDLKRMEMAYLDQNKREYEVTKHVSLMMNDPLALIALKETGQCEIFLPEALFDADYPGHYMRRLKNVSLTIPCVVGPYTSINCTLTLLSNKTRISNLAGDQYAERIDEDDQRFISNFAAMQSIATSHAQNDGGMFELNFRDERYLPFEGAGVISRWRIEMPKDTNAFDFNTLTDVVLHLKYTAREGGGILKNGARDALNKMTADDNPPLDRLFSLKHEFPTEWYRFLHPVEQAATNHALLLKLTQERFPFQLRGKAITLNEVTLFLKIADDFVYDAPGNSLAFHLKPDTQQQKGERADFVAVGSPISGLPFAKANVSSADIPADLVLEVLETDLPNPLSASPTTWWQSVKVDGVNRARLKPNAVVDIWMVVRYAASSKNN